MTSAYTQTIFLVKVNITVNGEHLITSTWESNENYDDCYRKIGNYIKRNTAPEDQIIKNIIHASQKTYPLTKWDNF